MPSLKDNYTRNRNVRWAYSSLIIVAAIAAYICSDNAQYFESFSLFGSDVTVAEGKIQNFQLIELLHALLQILAVILLFVWLYRSYQNANKFEGNYTSTSPGWAIGGFFIPFYNLYAGYKAVKETWNLHSVKSQETSLIENNPELKPTSLMLPIIWWILFLTTSVLGNIGQRMFEESEYISSEPYSFHMVEHLIYLVYAGVTVFLLKKFETIESETYVRYHQRDLMDHLTAE